jgi:hypothetical protein
MKLLRFVDQESGIAIVVPLDEAGCQSFQAQWHGIQIANGQVPRA